MKLFIFFIVGELILYYQTLAATQNDSYSKISSEMKNSVRRASSELSAKIYEATTNELVTALFQGRTYMKMSEYPPSESELFKGICDKLSFKIKAAKTMLLEMQNLIENDTDTPSYTNPCPFHSLHKMTAKSLNRPAFNSSKQFESKSSSIPNLKIRRKFFLSHSDLGTDRDCITTAHSSLRRLYIKNVNSFPRTVIFIVDVSMSQEHLHQTVEVLKETLYTLNSWDIISLRLTNGSYFQFDNLCSAKGLMEYGNLTDSNKYLILDFIASLKTTFTNLSHEEIQEDIRKISKMSNLPLIKQVILFTNSEKQSIWKEIFPFNYNSSMYYVIGTLSKPSHNILCSLDTLHASSRYYLNNNVTEFTICPLSIPGQVAVGLLRLPGPNLSLSASFQADIPYWEATEHDFMVPILLGNKQGILGLDLYWSDLAEDVTYFKGTNINKRLFVLDHQGTVVMHSFFPRPELSVGKIRFSTLELIENNDYIETVKQEIMSRYKGSITVPIRENKTVTYEWMQIENLFILCMAKEIYIHEPVKNLTTFTVQRSSKDILFHRLDLFPPKASNLCKHFKQIATLDQGTVFLSPSSFLSPFSYLQDMSEGQGQDALTYMQNYLAYLKGVAFGFLSNPGLKNEIQHDVNLLNSIITYYKRQHLHSKYSKYIVRRYAVSESGVLVMYPGTVLEYDYEPIRRPWYTSALENPGRIILTPPNFDVGGAGYIVSISYAITNPTNPIVVSMDVTMGFLYKMLIDSFPDCNLPYVKCFLMNNRGYLISHPGLMDPTSSGPIEQQHITHKESVIAFAMLNNKGFVTKKVCNNFPDMTLQRFYEFNMSTPNVVSNTVSGDHCVHYYIAAIPETNAFVGVVNATCDHLLPAFCPCSMYDRLCLNCNRMEQTECECPCECSSDTLSCQNTSNSTNFKDIPMCGVVSEKNTHKSHYFYNFAENLLPCFEFECELHLTYSSCLGVMGCEWCQLDSDGRTPLSSPFCTSQSSCFNGVLGAVTPYGEGHLGSITRDDVLGSYSAIGPIAGCILTVCLVIAVAIYCYKHNISSTSCHNLYMEGPVETWHENELQLSHLQSDDTHDHSGQDKLLPVAEADAPISPYKVLTGYKRPHTAGDSDHGYSTMTPHEDSEATAFSTNEPLNLMDDTNLSDVSCSVSSRMCPAKPKPIDTSVTVLPCGKNSIIAPVTVHRHMEAS